MCVWYERSAPFVMMVDAPPKSSTLLRLILILPLKFKLKSVVRIIRVSTCISKPLFCTLLLGKLVNIVVAPDTADIGWLKSKLDELLKYRFANTLIRPRNRPKSIPALYWEVVSQPKSASFRSRG